MGGLPAPPLPRYSLHTRASTILSSLYGHRIPAQFWWGQADRLGSTSSGPLPASPEGQPRYHDNVGQVCRAQGIDPSRAPYERGTHVCDRDSQGACGQREVKAQLALSSPGEVGRGPTHQCAGLTCQHTCQVQQADAKHTVYHLQGHPNHQLQEGVEP